MATGSRQAKLETPNSFLEHCENSMTAGLDHESWSVADSADLSVREFWIKIQTGGPHFPSFQCKLAL